MNIFSLVGNIMIDNSEANKSISKTKEEAGGMAEKLKNGIGTAAKWGAGVAAAASAVGGAMIAAAKGTAADLDVIDKASQRMGVTAEKYQELAYQAGLCGVEMSTMEKAAKKLEGTGLNMDEAIAQIYSLGSEAERSAKAADLFGEAVAYQMTPMLNQSAESMAAMATEARDLGLIMSEDSVKAGADMNDAFSKIGQSMDALKTGIMSELMPYIAEFLQYLIDHMPEITKTIKDTLDTVLPIVKPVLKAIFTAFKFVIDGIKTGLDWFDETCQKIKGWLDWFEDKVEKFKGKLTGIKDAVKGFIGLGGGKDGSHAAGLNYVPYDGYRAELHRGETVLNAQNTQSLLSDIRQALSSAGGQQSSRPIELTLNIDGKAFARATYQAGQDEVMRRGGSLVVG